MSWQKKENKLDSTQLKAIKLACNTEYRVQSTDLSHRDNKGFIPKEFRMTINKANKEEKRL